MKIFSGSSNLPLATKIADRCGTSLGRVKLHTFPSNEKFCQFEDNIRGDDIFIVQSTSAPCNDNLMELLVMADAARRASAERITAVIPYFGYARQDRKEQARVPISAKLVMDLLVASGIDRILTMDLHAAQIGGFTNLPVDHLHMAPILVNYLENPETRSSLFINTVVAPDIGAVKRSESFSRLIKKDLAIICKQRNSETEVEVTNFIGNVMNKNVLILDDLTESVSTLIEAAKACKERGAANVFAAVSHGCFSEKGKENIMNHVGLNKENLLQRIFYSNSINNEQFSEFGHEYGREVVDVSGLFSKAIYSIHNNESVSNLF